MTVRRDYPTFSADGGRACETNRIMNLIHLPRRRTTRHGAVRSVSLRLTLKSAFATAMIACAAHAAPEAGRCCPIVELRQYELHPGKRDTLIDLFDREFVESQKVAGMTLIAQFRDIDRPNVFTWLRGFSGMDARARSLGAFYDGPVWARHRAAANATMVSSDNVRLLHPAGSGAGFALDENPRPAPGATAIAPGLVVATIYTLTPAAAAAFPALFERTISPRLAASGALPFAMFETDAGPNTFPRLPVREGEHALVWFARFADVEAYDRHVAILDGDRGWADTVRPLLDAQLSAPMEIWRLTPTARSRAIR